MFCDASHLPMATGDSGKRILYMDDIGSSSSPKSETLGNKAWGLF